MEAEAQQKPSGEHERPEPGPLTSNTELSEMVSEEDRRTQEEELSLVSRSALFDRVGALVMIFDRQGRVRWFNRVCEETTGLSFEDVWGRPVWEVLVPPEEAHIVRRVLANLSTGRFARGYESHLMTREGVPRIIQWSTAPLLNGDGPVEHIVGVGVDITDRKRAEDKLRRSEEHYRGLVESSPDAIFVHHRGELVFTNRAGALLLGASDPSEIVGRPVLDFVHPDDRDVVETRVKKMLDHDAELALIEGRLVRVDGSVVLIDAHSMFPFMYQDKPAVQVVAREVSDTSQGQAEAREYRDMWDTLLSVSSAAIVTTDLRGRITEVSQKAAELMGLESPDAADGKSMF
jgi:PAS domain S-box-containing protein